MSRKIKTFPDYQSFELVPVPLSRSRRLFRGYNQSKLLAQGISKTLNLKLTDLAVRAEAKEIQALSLSKAQRMKNIKGIFRLKKGYLPSNVIVIDDVITSGATARELAKVLKKAGAKKVFVCSVAM